MEPTTVFAKTPLGHDEIATRARHLPARVRAMLIMIDGRHSVAQLLTGHPAPGEAEGYLRQLEDGGFIESAQPAAAPDLSEVRSAMTRMLIDFLGPEADSIAMRLERVTSREALLSEAEKLQEMLENIVGRERAGRFGEAVLPMLR